MLLWQRQTRSKLYKEIFEKVGFPSEHVGAHVLILTISNHPAQSWCTTAVATMDSETECHERASRDSGTPASTRRTRRGIFHSPSSGKAGLWESSPRAQMPLSLIGRLQTQFQETPFQGSPAARNKFMLHALDHALALTRSKDKQMRDPTAVVEPTSSRPTWESRD